MRKGLVSIIIVNWNGLHHLKKCLPSLYKSRFKNFEVILVDNGSVDKSLSYISKYYPKVRVILNSENVGFAPANNQGLAKAQGEYILLLNNDTVLTTDFLRPLVNALDSDPSLGAVQSKILSMDNPKLLDSVGSFFTSTGILYHYGYHQVDRKKYAKSIYTYSAKGACMMIRRKVIDIVGLFDDRFFAYFEESDLSHRIWLAGYMIKYIPESVIYHKIGGTSNSMQNSFIQFHSFKNRINSYIKNLDTQSLVLFLPFHLLLCEAIAVAFIFKNRFDLFKAINRSLLWNIVHLSETLKLRKNVQDMMRKKSDSEIFRFIKRDPEIGYYYSLFSNSLVGYKDTISI